MKGYRMLSVTKTIKKIASDRLHAMLAVGAFPKVHWEKNNGFESYYLFEYCEVWGKLTKILDQRMKEAHLDDELGIYTRKHSETFLAKVKEITDNIEEADIIGQQEHIRTFADELMDYASQ